LVSNALKYAFPDGQAGTVSVELTQSGREVCLAVSDDGIGMDTSIDLRTAESLGLRLVHMLVEQLGGTIAVSSGNPESTDHRGTRWVVKFIR
jgi:two-component sensor histidine kinase